MPETTTPQLTESDVAEIEARSLQVAEWRGVGQFGQDALALIRDWRALREQVTKFSELADKRHDELCEARRQRDSLAADMATHIRDATAALREQLAETEKERDRYKRLIEVECEAQAREHL